MGTNSIFPLFDFGLLLTGGICLSRISVLPPEPPEFKIAQLNNETVQLSDNGFDSLLRIGSLKFCAGFKPVFNCLTISAWLFYLQVNVRLLNLLCFAWTHCRWGRSLHCHPCFLNVCSFLSRDSKDLRYGANLFRCLNILAAIPRQIFAKFWQILRE